ncbi:MAG: EAL domain-containing protein [Gammaproteobacteria bacterium]|nr:EAL domain-containing protein [Gammaproteobacteria bacterium]
MSANETIRLLIINDSRDEVERLVSMLQNAGRSVRPQHAESEEAFIKLLEEQIWDLLIAHESSTQLPPVTALRQINRLNKDLPMILISDGEASQAVVEGLKLGARDVVQLDQDQHLLLVMQRELENREHRQRRRLADRKLREAERRGQQLLDSSRDAIAYVHDGMFLYVNQAFAECFGYSDRDDLDCVPVIDMVTAAEQDKTRQFLKDFSLKGEEAELCQLTFAGICGDGSTRSVTVNVATAFYDEELCIQFQLPSAEQAGDNPLQAQLQQIKERDPLTNLLNRQSLTERLEQEISKNLDQQATSTLLFIELDGFFETLLPELGVGGSEQLVIEVADFLRARSAEAESLARFSDNSYMLLCPNQSAEAALKRAAQLCRELQAHTITIGDYSGQVTASIGIAVANETSHSAEDIINNALKAVETLHTELAGNACQLYEPAPAVEEKSAEEIAKAVQTALSNNRFQLMFQPIISLRGSEDEHYEVLLRMLDENDELVSPSDFMQAAEKKGASTRIDRWAILETIKMLAAHRAGGHKTRVLLNLSSQSMLDETLAPWLKVAFQAANLSTDAVIFQVDERSVSGHLEAAAKFFKAIAAIGCRTSLSNFGCALNPFDNLDHITPDYVKVHGSFTRDIQSSSEGSAVLRNLIKQLLEAQKITIVPYVENASVLSSLWQTGVHYIQGHYLQGPAQSMNYDFNMEG